PFINDTIKDFDDRNNASIDDVIKHVAYIAKRIGVEHVGIGSDFDGYGGYLNGLRDISDIPNLTAGLLDNGFNTEEVAKIMGGNYLRVIEQVCG
ncbi:MAG: membrane dipeptidase, partial [Anaerolineaceae bacterium]